MEGPDGQTFGGRQEVSVSSKQDSEASECGDAIGVEASRQLG